MSQRTIVGRLLGLADSVVDAVNLLDFAETRGPAAVDRELDRLDEPTTRAVIRFLLWERKAGPSRDLIAAEAAIRSELEVERRDAARGGNR